MNPPRHAQSGFTLVELIVVITLIGIIAGYSANLIVRPMQVYQAVERRSALVEAADSALRRIARDLRLAVPNSIRITSNGNVVALEMLNTVDAGQFTAFANTASNFSFLDGSLFFDDDSGAAYPAGVINVGDRVIFSNLFTSGSENNAYKPWNGGDPAESDNYALTTGTPDLGTNVLSITAPPGGLTANGVSLTGDDGRFYISDGGISYICDPDSRQLRRYAGYSPTLNQPSDSSIGPLSSAPDDDLVVNRVADCDFLYDAGSGQRGLVTLELRLSWPGSSEEAQLLYQVRVLNDA